jgi:CheY-like chemotaxis protein
MPAPVPARGSCLETSLEYDFRTSNLFVTCTPQVLEGSSTYVVACVPGRDGRVLAQPIDVSTAVAPSMGDLTVLALEPDVRKASIIKGVVSAIGRTSLTVVQSQHQILDALHDGVPDLVLLPALLPWADEAQLCDALRSAATTNHFEVLMTPYEIVHDTNDREDLEAAAGWRRLLKRAPARPKSTGCRVGTFAERIEWALHCAQQTRLERTELFQLYDGIPTGAPHDRRAHRRFAGNELPWLQVVRLPDGARVRLLDLSAGGALVQSDTRLTRDTEGLLELVGGDQPSLVPFRVIRWQPSSRNRELPYLGAISFTGQFDFDTLAGPRAAQLSVVPEDAALAPFLRHPDEHQERDPRWTRDQVPWLSSVKLPWGPEVEVVNISKSGMLVETSSKLSPGSTADFCVSGFDTDLSVPIRVVRSEIGAVNRFGVTYQAAVTFTGDAPFPDDFGDTTPAPRKLAALLNDVLKDASRNREGARGLREVFADGVCKLVRAREVAIACSPIRSESGAESIYFTIPGPAGSPAILQATFEPDHLPTEAEFRCLQSAAALTTAVLEFERP